MPRRQFPVPSDPFPSHGLLPKDETQSAAFLKRFPDYDGRNIRVAVLDTGVDPAAFGLNGKGKVVDIIDCTGSGDIPLKVVEPLKEDGATAATASPSDSSSSGAIRLPGLSGRTLLVSPKWSNPTNQWKVGYRRAFDLWPRDLVKRREGERKAEWEVKMAELVSQAKRDLDMFEKESKPKCSPSPSATAAATSETSGEKGVDAQKDKGGDEDGDKSEQKAKKADLEARLSYLKDFSYKDPGPIVEVVVWNDGKDWRAVVGGAEGDGEQNVCSGKDKPAELDLRDKKPMTDYRKELHYERFGTQDLMSYSVNIVDDGETLSLSCVSGTHGTHVAAIIGGNVESNADLNGVAPGVEIVSLKIGDTRLGSLETGQALMRATKAILDTKCDICNMSYGEDAAWGTEDRGQFIAMLRDEVIKKRNVLFVAAAGNAGPALSTVGAPSTLSGIISVGAYETPSMQQAEYALLGNVPAGLYTWSSRGPTYDGANIVVYAPGASITGVPTYNLQRTQLMNGTSMASPNACGAISLVLSALKSEGIPYSPARVIKAIQATAKDVNDPQNVGLIQVEDLYKYLAATKDHFDMDADFDVSIVSQGRSSPDFSKKLGEREGMRGVYLREPAETSRLYEAAVWVKPSFGTDKETEKMYNLDMKLALAASEPWVKTPAFLSLPSAGRNFNIRVDPTQLEPGLHFAEIRAFDTASKGREIFTIPVTVCKPEVVASPTHVFKDWHTTSGQIERKYLAVPEGATWAELRITSRNHASPVNLWVHCVQLQPEVRLSKTEQQSILSLTAGETITKSFNVAGGVTMEICASQFWNSLPSADISMQIDFHGLTLDTGSQLFIVGGTSLPRLQVTSKIRLEAFSPSISFDRRQAAIRPSESKITPLGERDVMPDGKRLYQLVNSYPVKVTEKTKVKTRFVITDNLYDHAFSVLSSITDARTKVVQFGSVYSSEVELIKGDYTVQLQIEHSDYKVLESNKTLALTLEAQLGEKSKKLTLPVYRDHIDALSKSESTPYKNVKMPKGETRPLVIHTDLKGDASDLYKTAKAGDILLGKLSLGPGTSKASFPLAYVLPPQAKAEDGAEEKSKETPLLVDLQLSILDKIKDESEKQTFLEGLIKSHPTHLPLLVASLKALKDDADRKAVDEAADKVLAQIKEDELASYLGKKAIPADEMTEEEKKVKKSMEEQKSAWSLAYLKKIQASHKAGDSFTQQKELFRRYRQFVENPEKDVDFAIVSAKRDIAQKRFGSALKALTKLIDEGLDKEKYAEVTKLQETCVQELGWQALVEYQARWKLSQEPKMEAVW